MSKFKIGDKVRTKDDKEVYTVFSFTSLDGLKLVEVRTDGEQYMIPESGLELVSSNKYAIGNHLGIYRSNDDLDIAIGEAESLGEDENFVYRLIPIRRLVKNTKVLYEIENLEGDGE